MLRKLKVQLKKAGRSMRDAEDSFGCSVFLEGACESVGGTLPSALATWQGWKALEELSQLESQEPFLERL